ncbi:MAG: hypothetical protein AAB400_03380 [Patescibacteria group bacterium]
MSDYLCPQCGQTYDLPGVCDVCGVDLQPNDGDTNEEEGDELNDEDTGFDNTDDESESDPLAADFDDDDDDDEDGFDDE